jgi:hypothetical protein
MMPVTSPGAVGVTVRLVATALSCVPSGRKACRVMPVSPVLASRVPGRFRPKLSVRANVVITVRSGVLRPSARTPNAWLKSR